MDLADIVNLLASLITIGGLVIAAAARMRNAGVAAKQPDLPRQHSTFTGTAVWRSISSLPTALVYTVCLGLAYELVQRANFELNGPSTNYQIFEVAILLSIGFLPTFQTGVLLSGIVAGVLLAPLDAAVGTLFDAADSPGLLVSREFFYILQRDLVPALVTSGVTSFLGWLAYRRRTKNMLVLS